jgi:phosphatidylserine/phosphatidylglycerophosphate/cardiolipin synthase-like enzyme
VNRVIRKSHALSANEVLDLLGALLSAELVSPSVCLWLASPWITDVEVLDNGVGTYDSLVRFGRRPIRLTEVLVTLAANDAHVVVATTPDSHNDMFVRRLSQVSTDLRASDRVRVVIDSTGQLHTKALTGDDYALTGSMNITHNGIHLREEQVELHTEPSYVARARMDAYDRFGGVL